MAFFVVHLRFTEHQRRLEARPAHTEYLASLRAAGKLVAAGPWTDDSGALLIYDVADEAEVRALLAKDPYPDDVYEIVTLQEWNAVFPPAAG